MEDFMSLLGGGKCVSFDRLYLDPNNPRTPGGHSTGYEDHQKLFDDKLQEKLVELLLAQQLDSLMDSFMGSGWMPVDRPIVWEHPEVRGKYVVVEGNRRLATLRMLRKELEKQKAKFEKLKKIAGPNPDQKIALLDKKAEVEKLKLLCKKTDEIEVVPLVCEDPEAVQEKLMRVLAVRHINGAKEWGAYAQDQWMFTRYTQLFEDSFPDKEIALEQELVNQVAAEASVGKGRSKQTIRAIRAFNKFKAIWEVELPDGEEFTGKGDYYAFQCIVKDPWVREQFGMGKEDVVLSEEGEKALFTWMFKEPHNNLKVKENKNLWPAARAADEWGRLKKYDTENGTTYSKKYCIDEPEKATARMDRLVSKMSLHESEGEPIAVVNELTEKLQKLTNEQLENGGGSLVDSLKLLKKWATVTLKILSN